MQCELRCFLRTRSSSKNAHDVTSILADGLMQFGLHRQLMCAPLKAMKEL